MRMAKALDPREVAVAAQLRAEIAASEWKNVAAFHRALSEAAGPIDYSTYAKRLNGKIPFPTGLLLTSLDVLDIELSKFMADAMKRVPQ